MPVGYIMKDEGRTKFKIDKLGIPGHPSAASMWVGFWAGSPGILKLCQSFKKFLSLFLTLSEFGSKLI